MEQKEILIFIVFVSITIALFISAIVMFIILFRKKKVEQFLQEEKSLAIHRQELLNTQLEIQKQTMQQIGQEIHDNVGQKLTLASLYLQQLVFENKGLSINEKIDGVGDIINQSLIELRQLSKSLTDNVIESSSIISLLKKEFEKVRKLKKYKANLSVKVKELKLPYQTKSVILRVAQEFMQNSIKHADCKTIAASLDRVGDKLEFILIDDGKGFDPERDKSKGIGLLNMQKRIELIGGSYILESHKNKGTKLTIEIIL